MHAMRAALVLLAVLLPAVGAGAQTAARLGEGGPPTTILTPGRETRSMGTGAAPTTRSPVSTPAASAPSAGGERAPGRDPGTAQRPTPDQSR